VLTAVYLASLVAPCLNSKNDSIRNEPVQSAGTQREATPNDSVQNASVRILAILIGELQNAVTLNAVTLNAMDAPVVHSCRDAMDAMVAHFAATHFAVALHCERAVFRCVVELHCVPAVLRYVVGFRPLRALHFVAAAIQRLVSENHSSPVVPVRLVHDCASVSHSILRYLDRFVPDDLRLHSAQ
jgi:hypothetical protein